MAAKPILSTPVMKPTCLIFEPGCYYCAEEVGAGFCASQLQRLWGLPNPRPQAIRLHGFARPAKGRRPIRLRWPSWSMAVRWTSGLRAVPRGKFTGSVNGWLKTSVELKDRLYAGETITLYVELEVVEK